MMKVVVLAVIDENRSSRHIPILRSKPRCQGKGAGLEQEVGLAFRLFEGVHVHPQILQFPTQTAKAWDSEFQQSRWFSSSLQPVYVVLPDILNPDRSAGKLPLHQSCRWCGGSAGAWSTNNEIR